MLGVVARKVIVPQNLSKLSRPRLCQLQCVVSKVALGIGIYWGSGEAREDYTEGFHEPGLKVPHIVSTLIVQNPAHASHPDARGRGWEAMQSLHFVSVRQWLVLLIHSIVHASHNKTEGWVLLLSLSLKMEKPRHGNGGAKI